jgi:hypothetical protein
MVVIVPAPVVVVVAALDVALVPMGARGVAELVKDGLRDETLQREGREERGERAGGTHRVGPEPGAGE